MIVRERLVEFGVLVLRRGDERRIIVRIRSSTGFRRGMLGFYFLPGRLPVVDVAALGRALTFPKLIGTPADSFLSIIVHLDFSVSGG
jgi:hypothetical protein